MIFVIRVWVPLDLVDEHAILKAYRKATGSESECRTPRSGAPLNTILTSGHIHPSHSSRHLYSQLTLNLHRSASFLLGLVIFILFHKIQHLAPLRAYFPEIESDTSIPGAITCPASSDDPEDSWLQSPTHI